MCRLELAERTGHGTLLFRWKCIHGSCQLLSRRGFRAAGDRSTAVPLLISLFDTLVRQPVQNVDCEAVNLLECAVLHKSGAVSLLHKGVIIRQHHTTHYRVRGWALFRTASALEVYPQPIIPRIPIGSNSKSALINVHSAHDSKPVPYLSKI